MTFVDKGVLPNPVLITVDITPNDTHYYEFNLFEEMEFRFDVIKGRQDWSLGFWFTTEVGGPTLGRTLKTTSQTDLIVSLENNQIVLRKNGETIDILVDYYPELTYYFNIFNKESDNCSYLLSIGDIEPTDILC